MHGACSVSGTAPANLECDTSAWVHLDPRAVCFTIACELSEPVAYGDDRLASPPSTWHMTRDCVICCTPTPAVSMSRKIYRMTTLDRMTRLEATGLTSQPDLPGTPTAPAAVETVASDSQQAMAARASSLVAAAVDSDPPAGVSSPQTRWPALAGAGAAQEAAPSGISGRQRLPPLSTAKVGSTWQGELMGYVSEARSCLHVHAVLSQGKCGFTHAGCSTRGGPGRQGTHGIRPSFFVVGRGAYKFSWLPPPCLFCWCASGGNKITSEDPTRAAKVGGGAQDLPNRCVAWVCACVYAHSAKLVQSC